MVFFLEAVVSRRGAQDLSPGPRAWGGSSGPQRRLRKAEARALHPPPLPAASAERFCEAVPEGELQQSHGAETLVFYALSLRSRGCGWPRGRTGQVQGLSDFQIQEGPPARCART